MAFPFTTFASESVPLTSGNVHAIGKVRDGIFDNRLASAMGFNRGDCCRGIASGRGEVIRERHG